MNGLNRIQKLDVVIFDIIYIVVCLSYKLYGQNDLIRKMKIIYFGEERDDHLKKVPSENRSFVD